MEITQGATFATGQVDKNVDRAPQLNFEIPETLLAEVDFKWLMAGHGWHVDMVRFGEDTAYAAQMLDWAKHSNSQALRMCANVLQGHVGTPELRVKG